MPMDNVTLENTQQSISSRDAKSVASVMVNGKWVNLSDTLEQANVKSDVGTVAKQVAAQQEVVSNAVSVADSAQSAADAAIASAQVTSDAVSAIASATAEAKQGANDAMSRAKSAWDVATGAKEAVTDFDPLLKSAQSDAGKALTQIADTASALSDAKTAFNSDVAEAKELASTAQTTADSAVKSASSVADDLAAVANQAKANTNGITKVTSAVGALQATVADNSGNISTIQETAKQIQQAVSDNAGNITVATQTADSAVAVASDARSNATVAIQTASQASITANNASGQAASAVLTANGAMTTASNAKSDATVAVQTASGASLTATDAKDDATIAKQAASEATVQASNAESDFAQLLIRANKIEANVANNSGAIASVQQTANGLTSRVGSLESKTNTQQTTIDQNKKAIALKADQTTVDTLKGTVSQNTATLNTQANQIQSKVSASDVSGMLKGYATQDYTQSLVTQKADDWNVNLTKLKNDTQTSLTNLSATVDGIQSQVYNSDGSSKITQLSNLIQTKVGTDDFNNLKQAVGLQTLDSADINNMKTNGHYFVHNLANNPIGGWVYVDVTGDGSSRIRQDVYQDNGTKHKYRRWFNTYWTGWEEGATYTEINQLQDAINLRVTKGDLISQINLQAGTSLIQSNKLVLDAGTTVLTGEAWIPSAAIESLDASKLTFYGANNTYATIGASVAQYDDDKTKSTINLQYSGGIEIHSSNQQGSILTMHDNTIRLASKSWGDNPNAYQYSGFYAAPNYSLMNTYHKDGTTSGVAIDDDRIHIYGSSKDNQLGALQADVGWYSINGQTGLLTGNQISLKAGNTQAVLTDNNININNASDTNDKNYDVAIHVKGWAEMTGWFTCMGITQTSLLSTKTRIEPLDTKVALDKIASTNVETYQFKSDVAKGKTKRHASVIIDDVNDVAEYYTPEEFISENRMGRDDGDIIGYLMGAVQELKKQLDELKEKI